MTPEKQTASSKRLTLRTHQEHAEVAKKRNRDNKTLKFTKAGRGEKSEDADVIHYPYFTKIYNHQPALITNY